MHEDETVLCPFPERKYEVMRLAALCKVRVGPEERIYILGFTQGGRPLHVQCSYPSRPLVKIITLYEPDPAQWIDFRVRRT